MISLKTIHCQTQIWSVWKQFILKQKYDQSENNSFSNTNMISLKTIHSQTQIWSVWKQFILRLINQINY
jgi:hypothetical protein